MLFLLFLKISYLNLTIFFIKVILNHITYLSCTADYKSIFTVGAAGSSSCMRLLFLLVTCLFSAFYAFHMEKLPEQFCSKTETSRTNPNCAVDFIKYRF